MVLNILALVLALMSVSNSSADLEAMRRAGVADPPRVAALVEAGLAELDGDTPEQVCRNAFLAGELYRKADALLPNQGYAQKALDRFRTMRIEYMDLTAGQLGYIGEARVQLQHGDPEEALAVLAPLLDKQADPRMRRLAQLESLEAQLMIEPRQALVEAGDLGESADWVRARAYAAMGDQDNALKFARGEDTARMAPAFDRLQLIAGLGALNDHERAEWARELAAVGREDEALAILDGNLSKDTAELHAMLLQRAGRYAEALDPWRMALDEGTDSRLIFAYASCLEAAAGATTGDQAESYRADAIQAYVTVAASDVDDAMRRDALRRWFYLSGPKASHAVIERYRERIDSDPYLRYARLLVMKGMYDPDRLRSELAEIADTAEEASLRASAMMMLVHHEAGPREALSLLETQWELLSTESHTADWAMRKRVELWIELGMIDRAVEQLLTGADSQPVASYLDVASALAERYRDGVQGDAQQRVLELVGEAMKQAPTDASVALRAAGLMLRVEARADAARVLASLDSPVARCLHARALRELGRPSEALDRIVEVDMPEAALERSLCRYEMDQMDQALEEARAARGGAPAGDDLWWRATFAVVRAHLAMGQTRAAEDVLRVSGVMYPANGRAWLIDEINTLKKEVAG